MGSRESACTRLMPRISRRRLIASNVGSGRRKKDRPFHSVTNYCHHWSSSKKSPERGMTSSRGGDRGAVVNHPSDDGPSSWDHLGCKATNIISTSPG